jgi:hypothetical protein
MPLALDWFEIGILLAANGLVDCLLVAWVAGRQSQKQTEKWFLSPRSDKVIAKIASKVQSTVNLEKIEKEMGQFEARMTAQIPPNVHGELTELKGALVEIDGRMDTFATDLFKRVDDMPRLMRLEMQGEQGRQLNTLQADLAKQGKELGAEAMAKIPQANMLQQQAYKWLNAPLPKNTRDNPAAAAFTLWLKQQVAKNLSGGAGGELFGTVTGEAMGSPYGV